jgi:hypothetical protein
MSNFQQQLAEAIDLSDARSMPATCYSLTARYSLIASAARDERLRPVLFASFPSRFFTRLSSRTVSGVERTAFPYGVTR